MVCKVEVCQWFRYIQTFERLDLLCKLLHLCSAHELRFISAIVEDHARKDYTTLRESAAKVNDLSVLRKLRPNLFKASDRSTLIVYLSLLESSNMVCSHVLFEMLNQIQAQLACHLHAHKDKCPTQILDNVIAHDVMLLYTMAAYHPAFTISQRLQLSDYLEKAQTYLADYFKSDSEEVEGQIRSTENKSSSSSCVSSPHNIAAKSALPGIVKHRVHVKRTELSCSQWDRVGHSHEFQIQVTWSNGEVREISRSYQELHTFHVELIRLFPKDSGAHRQERQIPYLPQEKRSCNTQAAREFEEHINRYIKQLSALPDHMLECEHMTNFFRVREDSTTRENQQESNSMLYPLQSAEGVEPTNVDEKTSADELTGQVCNLTIPTAHALTTVLQQRYSYSSVVASPLTHHSPIPSPLSSPHVSPSQQVGISSVPVASTSTSSTVDTIAQWLKHLRLHKYAGGLSKYSWQQLAQLDDKVLEKEGLTDGAKKKFRKQLDVQLRKLVAAKNGFVSPVKVLEPSGSDGGHSCSGSSSSPVPFGPQLDVTSRDSPLHPVHHPLSVVTKLGYPASITNSSICSTNSIGSSSPAYSDYSGLSPPTSPRGHHWAQNADPVFSSQPHAGISAEYIGRSPMHTVGSPILESSDRLLPTVGSPSAESLSHGIGRRPAGFSETLPNSAVPGSPALSMQPAQGEDQRNMDTITSTDSTASDGQPAQAAFIEALQSAHMENPLTVLSPDSIDGRFPRAGPYMIPGSQLQREGEAPNPGILPVNPRIPGVPPIRPPMPGAKAPFMNALLASPPTVGPTLAPGMRVPLMTSNGQIESSNTIHSVKSQEPGLSGLDVGGKLPHGYPAGLLPRAPSLMGPAPGSHILQRPSNLGVHIPVNTSAYSVAPHLLPNPTTAGPMFDKGSPILFPPINVPPPALTPTSMDVDTFNVYHSNSNSALSFNGVPASNSLISPANSLTSSVSGPSTQQPLMNSPTVTRVTTPVTQGASNSSGSNSVSPVSMCQCNCPHCQGDPSQSGSQHQQPVAPTHSIPAAHHIPYPPPHISWSPTGAMFTGGFPIPGGFLSTTANGLVTGSLPHYTAFSPHLPPGAYSLPSNMTPDAAAAFIDARNYAMIQAAAQGIPLQHLPQFHYPVNHGLYPVPQLGNSHKNIMCYNCGGAGHMAYECKGPTMENVARTGQFHMNLQGARSEAD